MAQTLLSLISLWT